MKPDSTVVRFINTDTDAILTEGIVGLLPDIGDTVKIGTCAYEVQDGFIWEWHNTNKRWHSVQVPVCPIIEI